jgi:hypothetical protein
MVGRNSLVLVFTSALLVGFAGSTAQAQRGFGPGPGGFGGGFGRVVTGEPYTATATSTSFERLADGTTITHTSTSVEARDSEGRTYRAVTTPAGSSGQAFTRTTVTDPVAHTITEWGSQSTVATQIQLPTNPRGQGGPWQGGGPGGQGGPGQGQGRRRSNTQVTRTVLPAQTIDGVTAEGVKTTVTIPVGAQGNDKPLVSVREVWTASNLKIPLLETSDDPRDGSHKLQVNSLSLEADPTLFQVPQGYTVKTETRHRGN